jgi:MFS family permease
MRDEESKNFIIGIFSAASFLNDFGSDMIFPIWPLFVTSVLGADMAILGLIDGLGGALVSLSQAGSGYLSDRVGKRKVFIWTGYLCGSLSRIGYGLSKVWQHLIPFKILDRSGKIRGAPRDAIVADLSTERNRGRNFGLLRAMDNLGAVCGITACIFLFNFLRWEYNSIFLLASVPSLISALLVLLLIKERKTKGIYKGLSFRDLSGNLKLFLFLSAVFALGSFSYSFLLVYAKEFGFEAGFVPILYLLFTAVASMMSLPFGKLADKVGRRAILVLSYSLFGLMCLGFVYVGSFEGVVMLFILYGLHRAAADPVQRAFVSELSPLRYRASILGAFQLTVGLCALPASLIAGVLWETFEKFAPFLFSLSLTVLAVVLMGFVKES